jgi:anaerobic selenocysteine-containing dehydrogenase
VTSRRDFLKTAGAAASLAVFGATNTGLLFESLTEMGEIVPPDKPETESDVEIKYSVCLQCHSGCGIRCKIQNGTIIKIDGNPYHPNTLEPHIPYDTGSQVALNYAGRICAKGLAGFQTLYDPYRVKQPLKRSGPRGSGQWTAITWKQAVQEIANGGTMPGAKTGEPQYTFEGVSSIRKFIARNDELAPSGKNVAEAISIRSSTPDDNVYRSKFTSAEWAKMGEFLIDPYAPELGPKSNQLVHMVGRAEHGRKEFTDRWFGNAFGTLNMRNDHTDICELSHHVGYKLISTKTHLKPDILNCEFLILFGSSLLEAGFPFLAVARKMTRAINEGHLKYVVVDPRYSRTAVHAQKWVPIIPGGDGALAMGMTKWIIENDKYDRKYLENTTKPAATDDGETTYTNATYLVQIEGSEEGKFVKIGGKSQVVKKGTTTVVDSDSVDHGELDPGQVTIGGVKCKTVFMLLKDNANEWTLEQYATEAGVDVEIIVELAGEFTNHGKKAVADFYRGPVQHTNGLHTALAIGLLNVLIGNQDWKGGLVAGGSHWHEMGTKTGNPYYPDKSLQDKVYPAKVSSWGVRVSRGGSKYEDSTEYLKNGYPAQQPWFPLLGKDLCHTCLQGIGEGYPYPIKAVFVTKANFNYSTPGMKDIIEQTFKDSSKVPLFVAFDVIIGEFSSYADYILPDGTYLEQWGTPHVAPTIQTKTSGVRPPVVPLMYPDTKLVEDWLIEIAKEIGLPGFGDNGFDAGVPLNQASEWYLKAIANIASEGAGVPGSTEEEKINYVLARGGRFEDYDGAYDGEKVNHKLGKMLAIYNEKLGTTIDSMTGARLSGTAKYIIVADAKGNAIRDLDSIYPFYLITYKTAIHTQSRTMANPYLVELWPENWIVINPSDASILEITDGDSIRVTSATNTTGIVGKAKLREGIRPGVVGVSHNFGHWEYGAKSNRIDTEETGSDLTRGAGVQSNLVMRLDDSIGRTMCLTDTIGGSACFYDTRVKIEKV